MLTGMTGFGRAQIRYKQTQLTLQISSVNHRFFEVSCHIPGGLIYLEDRVKQYLHKKINRGKITFNLFVSGNIAGKISLDKGLAREYFQAMSALKKELSLKEEINLAQLSALPGVLCLSESALPEEVIWPRTEKLLVLACAGLLKMRFREGAAIEKDVLSRLANIGKNLAFIKRRVPKVISKKRARMSASCAGSEEVGAAAKSCDIAEEITRLAFHVKSFALKVKGNKKRAPLGKELDFITQEMQREANTMGAKAQDSHLSSAVIEIKSQIEKMREQIQNAE